MGISVVIPTFNRGFIITKTLDSLLAQTYGEFEVVIVDDGSTDTTRNVVQPYIAENIRYVRTAHTGTPHAWNLGVRESREDNIFLVADDVVVHSNCLTILAEALETVGKEKLGAIAPRLIYTVSLSSPTEEADKRFAYIDPCTGDVAGSFNVKTHKAPVEVPILHGYSLVRKIAFYDAGGFDEKT